MSPSPCKPTGGRTFSTETKPSYRYLVLLNLAPGPFLLIQLLGAQPWLLLESPGQLLEYHSAESDVLSWLVEDEAIVVIS